MKTLFSLITILLVGIKQIYGQSHYPGNILINLLFKIN